MAERKKQVRKRKVNGYQFPDPLPMGAIFKDTMKKEWYLGSSIGKGGFGEIYAATDVNKKLKKASDYPYVIKVEPLENGPLFVERTFYIKYCKPDMLEEWKKDHKLKTLGIPSFYGFGNHVFKDKTYRFVVMERFGKDIWTLFEEKNCLFSISFVSSICIEIIDSMEYIHSKGYIHGDIKGGNLLLGWKKGTEDNVFLVDFGLVCKYVSQGPLKKDPKKAHNGTLEYTSRDFHIGVPTMRGDLEILGYNIIHWLTSSLPWLNDLKSPEIVHRKKETLMTSLKDELSKLKPSIPDAVVQYLSYVAKLDHLEVPDYEYCRSLFKKGSNSSIGKSPARKRASENIGNNASHKPIKKTKGKEDDSPPSDVLDNVEVNSTKKITKAVSSKKVTGKSSWKDAPTVVASSVSKPGEYTKKTSTAKRSRAAKTK